MDYFYSAYVPFDGEYAIGATRLEAAMEAFEKAFPKMDPRIARPRFYLQVMTEGKARVPPGEVVRLRSAARSSI